MHDEDQFLSDVLSGISESEIITIFFPLLRRAVVIDTRQNEHAGQMIKVMPQVSSMEERIAIIERMRPEFGRIQSILGVPWMKSVRNLREHGVTARLVERLIQAGMPRPAAESMLDRAIAQLWRLERIHFARMIRGEGYATIWAAQR